MNQVSRLQTGNSSADNWFPFWARAFIKNFVLDKNTGNVTLNIKDGRILGIRTEILISPPKT